MQLGGVELLRWWLEHEKIEVPGSGEILSIMQCEIHASKIPAILSNITAGPSMLEILESKGRVE